MNTTYVAIGGGVIVLLILLGAKKGSSSNAQGIYGADPAVVNASVSIYQAQLNATSHLDDNRTALKLGEQSTSLARYTLDVQNQMNTTNANRDITLGGYARDASNHAADAQAQAQHDATAAQVTIAQGKQQSDSFTGFLGFLGTIVGLFI